MQAFQNYSLIIRNRIKTNRKRLGLTQEKLAEFADCSREHLARIENGKINIGLELFIRLAVIFNISLDELAGFDKSKHV